MSIEVTEFEDGTAWNDYVSRASHASPFHYHEALELIARLTDTDLRLLVGFKGQEPMGLLPLFEGSKGPMRTVISPPYGPEVFYLGHVMLHSDGVKERRRERTNRRFVDGCVEWIQTRLEPDLINVRTLDRETDLRPFRDRDFDIDPYYTYVVELGDSPDDLVMNFSRDARSNVRNADESRYEIGIEGKTACRRINRAVTRRFEEQGMEYPVTEAFTADLYDRLPEGTVRPYVCRVDGEFAGGVVALAHGDTVYRWMGGTKTGGDLPVNDLLDWRIMVDAIERGEARYDLVGANSSRLSRYKSKFGGDLSAYHRVLWRSRRAKLASTVRSGVSGLTAELSSPLDGSTFGRSVVSRIPTALMR